MLKIIISIFIFCLILFFYLHIQFHFKTGNDLEIFELQETSKENIEEIFDLRQPVLLSTESIIDTLNINYLLNTYPVFEIKIRNTKDDNQKMNSEMYLPLPLRTSLDLFQKDKNAQYFSEKNNDFLVETGLIKQFQQNDKFLRPPLVSNCNYDIILGSDNTITPFRYDVNYRNFYNVIEGNVKVKLSPPKSSRYLYPDYDYENFEFRSPINPWMPQSKYQLDFDKIKCLEIILTPGQLLFIPAYWWYSFQFGPDTIMHSFKYRTYMNNVAIIPEIFLYTLQNQNVERKIAKKIDILPNTVIDDSDDKNSNKIEINL